MSDTPAHASRAEYEITVGASFVASHQVPRPTGELEPLHDHDWRVEATFVGTELDDRGMLADFSKVSDRLKEVLADFDGKNLNRLERLGGAPPTAEVIAAELFRAMAPLGNRACRLHRVRVHEAPGFSASCVGGRPHGR